MSAGAARIRLAESAHPRLRLLWPVVAGAVVAYLVLVVLARDGHWQVWPGDAAPSTLLAVLLVTVVALTGDLMLVLPKVRNQGFTWSVQFKISLVVFTGLVPAVAVIVVGALVVELSVRRYSLGAWVVNCAAGCANALTVWTVLTASGWRADLADPWAPSSVTDVLAVVVADLLGNVVHILMVQVLRWTQTGAPVLSVMRSRHFVAGLPWILMTPVIVLVLAHVPAMTVLMVLPLTATHRAMLAEEHSQHVASHDGLTQLPNRGRFVHVLRQTLEESVPLGRRTAVLVVDLDGFKQVNDVLGHPVGDRVLVEAARRLASGVGEHDVVARTGGDEFGVVLPHVESSVEAVQVAERLWRALHAPCEIDGRDVDLGASLGVAVAPQHGTDFDTLYSRADQAMFEAKRRGTGPELYGGARADVDDRAGRP